MSELKTDLFDDCLIREGNSCLGTSAGRCAMCLRTYILEACRMFGNGHRSQAVDRLAKVMLMEQMMLQRKHAMKIALRRLYSALADCSALDVQGTFGLGRPEDWKAKLDGLSGAYAKGSDVKEPEIA